MRVTNKTKINGMKIKTHYHSVCQLNAQFGMHRMVMYDSYAVQISFANGRKNMLYLLIKRADTYLDELDTLNDNPDIDTERMELFAKQVLDLRHWYKNNVNNLHEAPPHSGSGSVSEYIIAMQAHNDEIAFSESYCDVYDEKYQALSGSVSRFISAYHSAVQQVTKQQVAKKNDVEHLQSQRAKDEKRHHEQIKIMIIVMIAASIGQWII